MVITRIISRNICFSSFPIVTKHLESAIFNRFSNKKLENIFSIKSAKGYSSYDGDGKTVGFVLNKKNSEALLINSYMHEGFVMSSGASFIGSMIIFPHSLLSWHITSIKDVNEDALVLFKILEPKIDILVLGYGNAEDFTPEIRMNFTKCCKNLGLRFEALPTEHAVGTYNFLADERRLVAGAFIPPSKIDYLRLDRSKGKLLLENDDDEEEEQELIPVNTKNRKLLK